MEEFYWELYVYKIEKHIYSVYNSIINNYDIPTPITAIIMELLADDETDEIYFCVCFLVSPPVN